MLGMRPVKKEFLIGLIALVCVLAAPGLVLTLTIAVAGESAGDPDALRDYAQGWGLPVGAQAPAMPGYRARPPMADMHRALREQFEAGD